MALHDNEFRAINFLKQAIRDLENGRSAWGEDMIANAIRDLGPRSRARIIERASDPAAHTLTD